jgi:alpha,alpha-trehalase
MPVVFLDYDGTLTPIVDDPDEAVLDEAVRGAIRRLRSRCPVAVVSGRDLEDVRSRVGVDGVHYAGSHGFDIVEADGTRHRRATEYLPALRRSQEALERRLRDIEGAWVERKRFAIAVHFRTLADPGDEHRVESVVDEVAGSEERLEKTGGKKIFELRPAMDWDKGRAVVWMLDTLVDSGAPLPLDIGDDVTDEDAFRALGDRGVGIVVMGEDERETVADYRLADTTEVRRFLDALGQMAPARRMGERTPARKPRA